jgi:UDPglucose--hexose-1-phosphate uridylyltransferase
MSEFRRDPFTGHWRLFAEGRSARPNEYAGSASGDAGLATCPFCTGRELTTPSELAAVRPNGGTTNGPGWTVRSFPNKFPTLEPSASSATASTDPFFARASGAGTHEVIVMSPAHSTAFGSLSSEQLRTLFRFFRARERAVAEPPGIRTTILFENKGPESGGTLPHPHAQLIATALVPDRVREESEANVGAAGGCALETVVEHELGARERIVLDDEGFVAFAPFASEHPFEVWVVPRRHAASFAHATDAETDRLAELLPSLLRALELIRPGASYNWFVHGLTGPAESTDRFHWHVELTPRLQRADGFELAASVPVNAVLPEHAADAYRRALADAGGKR